MHTEVDSQVESKSKTSRRNRINVWVAIGAIILIILLIREVHAEACFAVEGYDVVAVVVVAPVEHDCMVGDMAIRSTGHFPVRFQTETIADTPCPHKTCRQVL